MSYFVPETAKTLIEKDPEKALLNKYVSDATVLFVDIEGFTTLLKKYPHETVNRGVEYYFSMFFDSIKKYGGDINETAGDGMMVIFLDSEPETHAANAIEAALAVQKICEAYKNVSDPDLFPIQVKIGVSSGEVYLGSTKLRGVEGNRWTFTASGPVTVLAARLSEYGRGGQTLISEETARRVAASFSLQPLGKVPLKNLDDSGNVFQVSGRAS
jgi:class 3 adenylate cyclase